MRRVNPGIGCFCFGNGGCGNEDNIARPDMFRCSLIEMTRIEAQREMNGRADAILETLEAKGSSFLDGSKDEMVHSTGPARHGPQVSLGSVLLAFLWRSRFSATNLMPVV